MPISRTIASSLLAALPMLASCAVDATPNEEAPEGEGSIGQQQDPVQSSGRSEHYDYVKIRTRADKSTGIVEVPMPSYGLVGGVEVRGTCGVTFVTPHYAVTAAHCVPSSWVNPATTTLTVKQFNIEAVSDARLAAAEAMTGTFPNYTHTAGALTTADGYYTTTYTGCRVTVRCQEVGAPASEAWGNYNCPPGAEADVAVLRCPSRSVSSDWLPIAMSDSEAGTGIDMRWSHEVVDMPDDITGTPNDMQQHYTKLKPILAPSVNHADNFHYLGGSKNQLLPLRSLPWPTGENRTRVRVDATVVWTDLFGCHGTSGSGVLKTVYGPELLGPVARGGGMFSYNGLYDLLCHPPSQIRPGQAMMAYTRLRHTNAALFYARNDLAEYPRIEKIEWTLKGAVTTTSQQLAVCADGVLFAYDSSGGVVRKSTDEGVTWTTAGVLPTGLRSLSCSVGSLYYLTSDRKLWSRSTTLTGSARMLGYPWGADDIGVTEDSSMSFPIFYARNTDNTLWRSGTGVDGSWTRIGTTVSGTRLASSRSALLTLTTGGTIHSSRMDTISWSTVGTFPAARDLALASQGGADADVRVFRLDTTGNVWMGSVRFAFGL